MRVKSLIATIAMIAVIAFPRFAAAESAFGTGSPPSATVSVNFSVTIPQFLFFQVGALGGTPDTITFSVPSAVVGDSSSVAGTGGNLTSGTVTVRVLGNIGDVEITENAGDPAPLTSASGTISWDEILTTDTGDIPALQLADPGIHASATLTASASNVVNANGTWTYSYKNRTIPAPDTYLGTATYSAAVP